MSDAETPDDDGRTPPDHTVIGLRIEAALLPGWFEEVRVIAASLCRRMAVIERPEGYVVQLEVHRERLDALNEALESRWATWNDAQRGSGSTDDA